MKVVSVNIGKKELLDTPAGAVETGIIKTPTMATVVLNYLGILGDAIVDTSVHGGTDQAIYIYSQEDYDWWSSELGKAVLPGMFGENLTLSSLGSLPLVIGDRLAINNVVLEISAPRTPCFKLAARMGDAGFVKRFVKAVRPGAYARVIVPGEITCGDSVTVTKTSADYPTVNEVYIACHAKKRDRDVLRKALDAPLGWYHKELVQKLYRSEMSC